MLEKALEAMSESASFRDERILSYRNQNHNLIPTYHTSYMPTKPILIISFSTDIPFETENDLRIKGTARTPDVLLSTPVGMKVPKRSSTSRKLLLDENDAQFTKGNDGEADEEEHEWKVVCWIDSKVRVDDESILTCPRRFSPYISFPLSYSFSIYEWIHTPTTCTQKAMFGDVQTHNNSVLPQAESFVHRFGPGLILYWYGHAPIEFLGDGHGDVLVTGFTLPDEFMLPTGEFATAKKNPCLGRRIDRELAKMQGE
jgi:hypothetical protein